MSKKTLIVFQDPLELTYSCQITKKNLVGLLLIYWIDNHKLRLKINSINKHTILNRVMLILKIYQ